MTGPPATSENNGSSDSTLPTAGSKMVPPRPSSAASTGSRAYSSTMSCTRCARRRATTVLVAGSGMYRNST
ncbi:Uncharacterised protein [Mycobacteroides abscessus subsp. abscessus]|nr:Uncharacterised protein [Mycobacteroides abscessus subsp. abscessus]